MGSDWSFSVFSKQVIILHVIEVFDVQFAVLVTEKEIFLNMDYNTSEIQDFIENPEEVGTSREPR